MKYLKRVFLVLFPLYMMWTFDHSLWNPDETRDAGIAREMYVTQDFVTPHLNGEAFLEKPPLYYWTCSAVYAVTGRITAGLTRLPAALYGFIGIFFTFLIGRRLWNNARTGFMAAGILATSFQYFNMSHYALMDSSLAAFLTAAFYFYLAGGPLGFITMVILAFFTKGFVAVALAGLVILVDAIRQKTFRRLTFITILGIPVFLIAVGPWVYKLWQAGGENYLRIFFIDNNWDRFFSHTLTDHKQPVYYYLGSFLADFAPWTLLFIPALWSSFPREPIRPTAGKDLRYQIFSRAIDGFLKTWFFSMFIFLSLSSSKRSMYLLPAMPAAALITAGWLSQHKNGWKIFKSILTVMVIVIVAGDIFFIKRLDRDKTFVPFIERVKQERQGANLVAYDLSEMERGVFPFYLEENITNLKTLEEVQLYLDAHKDQHVVLITNRNKFKDLDLMLNPSMKLIYTYRPDKTTRSYLLYSK